MKGERINPDILIQTDADWQKLRAEKMSAIVDPMIVRSADLWLRGRSGQTEAEAPQVWAALRELGTAAPEPDGSSGTTIDANLFFISLSTAPEKLLGWIPGLSAGKRHVKVLMRSMRASHEQKNLAKAVQFLWSQS